MQDKLDRFIKAQENDYIKALNEIKAGKKTGHWIWYIFPQIDGFGKSITSKFYAIKDINEAKAYLNHELLGNRLKEISAELLKLEENNVQNILKFPDDLKLKSSMTLFAQVDEEDNVFNKVLEKYFDGKVDIKTIEKL